MPGQPHSRSRAPPGGLAQGGHLRVHPPACLPALFSGQAPAAAHVGCSWAALHAHQDCLPRSVDGQALGRVPNFRLVFLKERLQRLDEGGQVLIHQRIGGGGGLQGRVWVLA